MLLGPYTIFHKGADQLVKEYILMRSGMESTRKMIFPVVVILKATLEEITNIPSSFTNHPSTSSLVLSHLEDSAGPISECGERKFTMKPLTNLLDRVEVSPGNRVTVHVMLSIKPRGMAANGDWPVEYHSEGINFGLGFHEILCLEKI